MAVAVVEQTHFIIGADDPSVQNDPSSVTWGTEDAASPSVISGSKFHLRLQVAEVNGGNFSNVQQAVYYNTTNDPSTAIQVTTDGSTNAVQIVSSTSGQSIADGTATTSNVCTAPVGTWVNGSYIESSNLFAAITLKNQYTEQQVCLQFTANATVGQTYYFWIFLSDGAQIDTYTAVPSITLAPSTVTVSNDTSWAIADKTGIDSAWKSLNTLFLSSGWAFVQRSSIDTAWKDFISASKSSAWMIIQRTYDVEWRIVGETELAGSAYGLGDTYYVATGLNPGTAYEWRVRAVENDLTGFWSDWVQFETIQTAGTTEKISKWIIFNAESRQVSWKTTTTDLCSTSWRVSASSSIDAAHRILSKDQVQAGWEIYIASFDFEWRKVGETTLAGSATNIIEEYYDMTGLESGVNYEWRVRAVIDGVQGLWTDWKVFTTLADTGVLRAETSWTITNTDYHNAAWRFLRRDSTASAWKLFSVEEQEIAWILAPIVRRKNLLIANNLGESMQHKLTAGLGIEVPLLLSIRLSEGQYANQKLLSSIAAEPLHRQHLFLQTLAEKDDIRVYLNLLSALSDPGSQEYSVPVEVKIG